MSNPLPKLLAYFAGFATLLMSSSLVRAQDFSVGANFTTQTRADGIFEEPPDTMGAAGPNDFVAFVNNGFVIYNKDGSLVSRVSETSFWAAALGLDPGNLSDPRILYDPVSQRWFTSMITIDQTTNNKILIARSNTADPTQGFKGVAYTTTNNLFADFPTLGLDANGVYVGTNNFTAANAFTSEVMYNIPKVDLLADTPSLARLTKFDSLSIGTFGDTLQPAVSYGPKAPTDPEPIVAVSDSNFNRYIYSRLNGTSASGATIGGATVKSVQSTSTPNSSAQPGSSTTVDNGERNFSSSLVQEGNFLYSVMGTRVSGRTAARWTITNATTFVIVQQGTISSSSLSYFYPSIAVNTSGDVVIGFSGSNSSTFASTYAVVGSSAGGVPGGTLTFGAPVQTKAGVDFYDGDRWGDYSATTVDPADPGIFWTHQEYSGSRSGSGTNWNWATQATEIIPNKNGERRWSSANGGDFATAGNYFANTAPAATDHVIFSRASTSYTVSFTGAASSNRASVRQGNVTWDLSSGSYNLTNASPATPSLSVAEFQGTASLTLSGGNLTSLHALIGGAAGGNGSVNLAAGANWTNGGDLIIADQGTAALNLPAQSTVYVGGNLSIGALGTLNLTGGKLRLSGYSRSGTLNYSAGTVQLAGDRQIGVDATVQDLFGSSAAIDAGKSLIVEGNALVSPGAGLTMSGGTFAAQSLSLPAGAGIMGTQASQIMAPVVAQAGSAIDVVAGELAIGDSTSATGFYGNGTIHVLQDKLTLADADDAILDASARVALGSGASPGTLAAANGLTLNAGGTISGLGTIDTPNDPGKPITNRGSIAGQSLAAPITLSGYVQGTGAFDNVDFAGTFAPGPSPIGLQLGSAQYDGTLNLEVGGMTAGTDYDQLNHSLGDGLVRLGGALDIALMGGFIPQAGEAFDLITATGGVTGTFASTLLPALPNNLLWNLTYGPNDVVLAVSAKPPTLPGDYNNDGIVDAADYTVWRDMLGQTGSGLAADGDGNGIVDANDYDVWKMHFGETALSAGAGGGSHVAVPEPSTLALFTFAATVTAAGFCGSAERFGRLWRVVASLMGDQTVAN
jgi:T5SS/PEP-CTERM-associated repeat protein